VPELYRFIPNLADVVVSVVLNLNNLSLVVGVSKVEDEYTS
jgi:hypothetical protein